MSDIRIALVAEGPTDRIIIEAALKALVPCSFVLTVLQPEATRPAMGQGWGGVLKWCHAASLRHHGSLDTDPTLGQFDLLILHVDADVADMQYANCGAQIVAMAAQFGWRALPCSLACPPAVDTCRQLRQVLASWLRGATPGTKTVLCIPSKSIGAWLAAAVLPPAHALLVGAECNVALENQLGLLPKALKVKKSTADFRKHAATVASNWPQVAATCSQALAFQSAVLPLATVACTRP